MELFSLFITPVFKLTIDMDNTAMIEKLYNLKSKDEKGDPKSNVGGWHSHDNLFIYEEFKNINADIVRYAQEAFNHMSINEKCYPVLQSLWGIINPPGSRNNVHTHPHSFMSGVYYMKVPPKSGEIVFLEPKPQSEILDVPKNNNPNIHLAHSVSLVPEENNLIFFPSWLQHEVMSNLSNKDRVILSFNIDWKKDDADS
tara:strand:+ start:597 stop:1193 length:597 start_codon:yes stop_codon:yes gene_type:complete